LKATDQQHGNTKSESYRRPKWCIGELTCILEQSEWQANNGAHDSTDERDPHQKIKTTKNIIERFLPVDGRWRTNNVLSIPLLATNSGKL
jgi:hypothetical protein